MARRNVGILLFNQVEVLDFCGPFEVFSIARLDEQHRLDEASPFAVKLIAQTREPIVTSGGMQVLPQHAFEDCPPLDLLVVPGGMGARTEMANETLLTFVKAQAERVELLASVCTGALILGKAGLLDGLPATTHWAALDLLRRTSPHTRVVEDAHVVEAGKLMTSAGISAGIDLALRIVARCHGEAVARAAARRMEYPYPESNGRRVPTGAKPSPRVVFQDLPWESPMPGVRCKIHKAGDQRVRLVEYAASMAPHWCQKGHMGCILEGTFEIAFDGETHVYRAGDGVFIPDGPEHRHCARTLTETVTALFVEKA